MDGTTHRAATLALGAVAAATALAGIVTVAARGGDGAGSPATTPAEAASRLFHASVAGRCAELRALMTDEYRAQLDRVYPDRALGCAALRGAPGSALRSVRVAYRSGDRVVVVLTTRIPDEDADGATALLFVRRGDRWLDDSESLDCAEPAAADPRECDRFALP
jgi:hypothetical protein